MAIYLTGASGYLGGETVLALSQALLIGKKVYIPVRDKNGKSGKERFESIFGDCEHLRVDAQWVAPTAPIPDDTEVVILNAFDVAFHQDIGRVLRDSVAPMLALVRECEKLSSESRLRKVIVVSTAYVQPPFPFRRCDAPVTPFSGAADPWGVYDKIVAGELVWKDLVDDPDNDPHFTQNAYIYAKTLMEHLVSTFDNLPHTYLVRPSIIGPSSCGQRGSSLSPGCASAKLMQSRVGRFVPSTGCTDNVFVDDVARSIARVATDNTVPYDAGLTIIWATNGVASSYQALEANINPRKWVIQPPVSWRRLCIRVEGWLAWLVMGRKARKALLGFYRSYTYFTTHTFDFQQSFPAPPEIIAIAYIKWLANET